MRCSASEPAEAGQVGGRGRALLDSPAGGILHLEPAVLDLDLPAVGVFDLEPGGRALDLRHGPARRADRTGRGRPGVVAAAAPPATVIPRRIVTATAAAAMVVTGTVVGAAATTAMIISTPVIRAAATTSVIIAATIITATVVAAAIIAASAVVTSAIATAVVVTSVIAVATVIAAAAPAAAVVTAARIGGRGAETPALVREADVQGARGAGREDGEPKARAKPATDDRWAGRHEVCAVHL